MFNIQEIDPRELAEWMQREPVQIIDVREQVEVAAGTLEGAEHIPMRTIPWRLGQLDRNRKAAIICRSGARSAQVCAFLQAQGFENVYNLRGGVIAWARAGLAFTAPLARIA